MSTNLALFEPGLTKDKNETTEPDNGTVTVVTKHNTEKEWESNDVEDRWISFLVRRHTISISDHLVHEGHLVADKASRFFDLVAVVNFFDIGGRVVVLQISDLSFLINRAPEVANVGLLTSTHHVERVVDGLLLGNEPFVNLKSVNSVLWCFFRLKLVDFTEVTLQGDARVHENRLVVDDFVSGLSDLGSNLINRRNVEALTSLERVTDLLNTFVHESTLLVHNHVSGLKLNLFTGSILLVAAEVGESLTASHTEEDTAHVLLLLGQDGTSDESEATTRDKGSINLIWIISNLLGSGDITTEGRNHGLAELEHLIEVFLSVQTVVHFFESLGLLRYELLQVADLGIKVVK